MVTRKLNKFIALCALMLCGTGAAWSQVTVLTFEGLGDHAEIGEYYNGGAGGNFGISFLPGSLALVSDASGGGGNFSAGSSGATIAYFVDGNSAVMNVASGFTAGFSFYYGAFEPGTVTVYDGPNATGNVLGSLTLAQTVFGDRVTGWESAGIHFEGTAYSVSFGGAANMIGFDDITIGSAVPGAPIPEPSTYAALLGAAALVGVCVVRRRRARAA